MPRRSRDITQAMQDNRDLRNQLHAVEFPLQRRIRELEVERDKAIAESRALRRQIRALNRGMKSARGMIRWMLSAGKWE
jgi:hypothetical protein